MASLGLVFTPSLPEPVPNSCMVLIVKTLCPQ
jgi:hypothetical protein